MEPGFIVDGSITGWGLREKCGDVCVSAVRWIVRIFLLVLLVGIIAVGVLLTRPRRQTSPSPIKDIDQNVEESSTSETPSPSQRRRRSRDKTAWDSARSMLEESDLGTVAGSFKYAGMGAKMGKGKEKQREADVLDVEDTCTLQ